MKITAELIAMIVLNSYLVAALLTVTKMYFSKKSELRDMTTKYNEKRKDWYTEVNEKIELYGRIGRLEKENKELKDEQIQSNH